MIVLIGAGNMGYAMLHHWSEACRALCVFDPAPAARVEDLAKQNKIRLNPKELSGEIEAIVLAVKPDKVSQAVSDHKNLFGKDRLLISIAAGVDCKTLQQQTNLSCLVRAMPNTPAQIGKGWTALYATEACSAQQKTFTQELMGALGQADFIDDESLMDAITVLSGCGPAYLFYLAEVLIDAGAELGIEEGLAKKALIQTLLGAAALLAAREDPTTLRTEVTSPGGVTEAAFKVLLADEPMKKLFKEAFRTAHQHAQNLKG